MIAHRAVIDMRNDDWLQVGKYLIIKQMSDFKAHQISIIEDQDTVKAVMQIISSLDISESFIALQADHKIENSLLSK